MGIRFQCHECSYSLNVKSFLAGKRGTCPKCGLKFRIPPEDQEFSIPLASKIQQTASGNSVQPPTRQPASAAVGQTDMAKPAPSQDAVNNAAEDFDNAAASYLDEPRRSEPQAQPDFTEAEDPAQQASGSEKSVDALSPLANKDVVWYVRPPSGGQFGPAESDLMQQWIGESRVVPGSLVWRDGWPQWRLAEEAFPEHFGNVKQTPSIDLESDLPAVSGGAAPASANESKKKNEAASVGAAKRSRRKKQTQMIAILVGVSVLLIGTLIVVVILTGGSGSETQTPS